MGLGLAIIVCLCILALCGFLVIQAQFAARKWRSVIASGDHGALMELLDITFEGWRNARPPKGMPPADWRALHTVALVAADQTRVRVSMLAEADIRVIKARRDEVASEYVVARRVAVRMVERLLYEVSHASFDAAQVDVHIEYRDAVGKSQTRSLLSTIAYRDVAALSDWEDGSPEELLAEWQTSDGEGKTEPNPDMNPLIAFSETVVEPKAEPVIGGSSR